MKGILPARYEQKTGRRHPLGPHRHGPIPATAKVPCRNRAVASIHGRADEGVVAADLVVLVPGTGFGQPGIPGGAVRADEPIRPTHPPEVLAAGLVIGKPGLERRPRPRIVHPSLETRRLHNHNISWPLELSRDAIHTFATSTGNFSKEIQRQSITVSGSGRTAGLKSVPLVYASGVRQTCCTVPNGMLTMSATASSIIR